MTDHFRSRKVSPRKHQPFDDSSFPSRLMVNTDFDDDVEHQKDYAHQPSKRGILLESRLTKKIILAIHATILCAIGFFYRDEGYHWFPHPSPNVQELLDQSTASPIMNETFSSASDGEASSQQEQIHQQPLHHIPPSWTPDNWDLSTSFPSISDESQQKLISDVCSTRKSIAPLHGSLSINKKNVAWTLCMTITAGFYDFFRNWYLHYEKLGLNLDMVLFAEDPLAFQRLSNAPFLNKDFTLVVNATFDKGPSNFTATNATSDQVFDVFSNQYFELISNRPSRLLQVLCSGRNVLYIDTDTVLKMDPLPEINKHYLGADFIIAIEQSKSKDYPQGFEVCTGFVAIKAGTKTINFLSAWENKCHDEEDGSPINDQIAFNRAYEAMWIKKQNEEPAGNLLPKVEGLRSKLFPNGFQYFELYNERQRDKVVLAHANWIIGGEKKKQNFQEHGLWLIPDKEES